MRRTFIQRLRSDDSGSAAVEFGALSMVLMMMLMGGFDLGHTMYVKAILQGEVQRAARASALETGADAAAQGTIDQKLRTQIQRLNSNATVTISRRFYRTFSKASAAQHEPFTDTNSNGVCDNGEPYTDQNFNNTYDADGGDSGQGGAKDIVIYTARVTYPRLFPVGKLLGFSPNVDMTAQTVLANQPYGDQNAYSTATPPVRNCP